MALNLRQKQTECIIRMLNPNQPLNPSGTANEEVYKILIYDTFCQNILSPLINVKDLQIERISGLPLHCLSVVGESSKSISPFILHTDVCEKKLELSHILRLNPENEYGPIPKSIKIPVVAESYNELVFPDPSESFLTQLYTSLTSQTISTCMPPPDNLKAKVLGLSVDVNEE